MPLSSRGRSRARGLMSAVAVCLAAVLALPMTAASAAPGDPQYLSLTKTVDRSELAPGDSYTYRVEVSCSEQSCLDAVLRDTLGEHAGHELRDVQLLASAPGLTFVPTWTSGGVTSGTAPTVVAADTRLDVTFTQPTVSPTGVGIQSGQTFTVTMTLRVPADLPPRTDVTLENTATVTASNSSPATGAASVHVVVPVTVAVTPTKSWAPGEVAFVAGAASTVRLGATNAANVAAARLVLQEPAVAPEGAESLDASNPFALVDLASLTGVAVPAQCTDVTVDAYVLVDGVWTWVPGTGGLVLPGVDAGDVAGVRVTCEGDVPVGATLSLDLGVTQRTTHRTSGADLSRQTHSLVNTVAATADVTGLAPVTRTATAPYRVTPARLGTEVEKSFAPARVSGGESSVLSLVAAQASEVPVSELRIADLGFFGTVARFGGFADAPTWPTGAATATVVHHLSDGTTQDVAFDEGDVPGAPTLPAGVHVTGVEIVFTGVIQPDAVAAGARVVVTTAEDPTGPVRRLTNTATGTVTAANGNTATDDASAVLEIVPASITVGLTKTVRPGATLRPGDRAVTELRTSLAVSSSYVTARELEVTDAWDGAARGFWDAFDLAGIAATQVPSGVAVAVSVQTVPGTWVDLPPEPARPDTWLLAMDADALAAALPGGTDLTSVTGVRLVLTDVDGFEENTTVTPYLVTTARAQLRSGGALPTGTTTLPNAAVAGGSGTTTGGTPVSDSDAAVDEAGVTPVPSGAGAVEARKTWTQAAVAAQTGQQRTTRLAWRTAPGASSVAITDPAEATDPDALTDPAQTVFDAFDLVRVPAVAYSPTPFSNGWYLRYDTVTDVQLLLPAAGGTRTWQSVTAPAGGWHDATGFVGHRLTAAQRADARGVRLVLGENTAARQAAGTLGATLDPFAPLPGTGVAAASVDRTFDLVWQLREVRRSGGWVTHEATYNRPGAGVVRNTVDVTAQRPGGPVSATNHADIVVTGSTPLVRIEKTVSTSDVAYVPRPGVVAAADWPARTFTVRAWNDSVARASYVRVSDPACSDVDVQASCALADPTADPFGTSVDWLAPGAGASAFDRFDLVGVAVAVDRPAEVDLAASTAWVLRYRDGAYVSERTTVAALAAMTAAQLADVVGVSATFQGTDPAVTGGTITQGNRLSLVLSTRLRTHVRSTGAEQTLRTGATVDVENHAYAQSYDPVLAGDVLAAGTDDARVRLTGGDLNVGVTKTVTPSTVTEPTRAQPLTVTLRANQGTAPVGTLAPAQVRLQDDAATSPEFWDAFDLVGLGAVTLPAGADRVAVDVHGPFGADGADAWLPGTPAASSPALPVPAERLSDVQGVRVVYSRADGGLFSTAVPAAGWSAQVQLQVRLRDTARASGDPITLDGTPLAVENVVVAQADRLNGEVSQERASAAVVTAFEGTHELAVTKLANGGDRTVDVGRAVPWDLTFGNTGTGYLTVAELRDTLPASLVWTGETAPEVTVPAGGGMSDRVTVTRDGADLVVAWPADARTLAPGESVTVRLQLELQPGLGAGQRAVNTMTVRTDQTLDACTAIDGSRPVTGAWASDATTCGATDHVQPRSGPNLFTVKGVRGSQPGAATPDGQECSPLVEATGGAYYRTPCVARSLVGGVDDWVLRVVNGGTTSVEELTVFDPLAAAGDTMIISGQPRGSVYRPQVVAGSLQVTAPTGATVVTEVTTTPDVCAGTWAGLTSAGVCEQSGESWAPVGPGTDWSAVTGLRVRVDLRTSAGGALLSGQAIDVTFSTRNVPADADAPDGVPAGVAADDVVAWNQFGVRYRDLGAAEWKKIAPAKVGVEVLTGPLEVRKVVDGAAAGYAPTSFTADVVCTLDGAALDLGAAALLTLDDASGYVARLDGIPLGARCAVTETGAPGDHGEATRTGTVHVEVDERAAADGSVPAAQVATVANTYAYGEVSVTKRVDSAATTGLPGPYTFALTCTAAVTGEPVLFSGAEELTFEVADGGTFTVPAGTVPVGATCALRETGTGGADSVVMVGDGVAPSGPGAADVSVGTEPVHVEVVNGFDAGVLEVRKEVDGDGAATWGAQATFGFTAVCTYAGRTVLDERFDLRAGRVRTFGVFPVGTSCLVEEVATGGATRTALAPADGVVTVDAPVAGDEVSTAVVTVTNTFDLTSVDVVKRVTGDTTAEGAQGPFTVALACTWPVDGDDVPIAVPGGAERVLRAPSALTATWAGLPVGADCVVTETVTGGAAHVSAVVAVAGGEPVATDGPRVPVVGLAGTTGPGQAVVELVNRFDAAEAAAARPPLALTGADVLRVGLVAALLAAVGGVLLVVRRRAS
ncbi:hypothetical protein SAMN05216467_2407 [Cellulomonas sp. KH9]|nr:hypothetical protein SAMN05216467_2407 [Cellulomonas sp. KH9]